LDEKNQHTGDLMMITKMAAFSQLLSLVNRNQFKKNVELYQTDKAQKGLKTWHQFVAMTFCQLANAKSLREICGGMALGGGKLRHLGVTNIPKRSTLSYANKNRNFEVFEDTFYNILDTVSKEAKKHGRKFRFKNPLYSLDATIISLCADIYDWAQYRTRKGAVKLHMLLDHDGCLPCWCHITEGKVHDVKAAHLLELPKGAIVAMDRGYLDYLLFDKWNENGVFFVTRTRSNTLFEIEKVRDVPEKNNVLSDYEVKLTGVKATEIRNNKFRVVKVYDEENAREIEILTNIMHLSADTIGKIYKERWQIELFFKAIKQNLRIKTFVGTSENAVRIQIWTALISMLLLKYMQLRSKYNWSLSNLTAFFRMILLRHLDLWDWLDSPFEQKVENPPGEYSMRLF
jgi:hypothetical protein